MKKKKEIQRRERVDYLIHLPNRIMIRIFGTENYEKLKKHIKGN